MNNLITGKDSSLVSHPPHLTSVWSSSLIPFCAYKTNLNISRNRLELPGITYPLCSSFLPTILEGQLCYELTLNMTSGQGKKNELMLLLDYNEERSLHVPASSTIEKVDRHSKEILNFDTAVESLQGKSIKVHIETISPYVSFGGGTFTMADVKRMSAKDDFLKMSLEDRKCEVELYEDCRTRKLLKECNCVPWEVPGYQVKPLTI